MLDHQLLRALKSAATLIEKTRDADVSDLTDDEFGQVDDLLTTIIEAFRVTI
ncbi:hypothetical protein ACIA5C_47645 [Actinoplanes sp. NPDC051343]|uniref:hypothetical protein n=1 Tax=Actinoplanes sp. NPDC051343 TaxID=3363906 RepID=UPI0037A47944